MKEISNDVSFQFPSEWDDKNERAIEQYNKCGNFYSDSETFINHYNNGTYYNILYGIIIGYSILGFVLVLNFRKTFEISKHNLSLCSLYMMGLIINIMISYLKKMKYYSLPCYIVSYSLMIGYPLLFFSNIGFIFRYIKYCYTNYSKYNDDEIDKEKEKKRFGYYVSRYYSDDKLITIMLLFIIISLIYITVLSLNGISFSLFPLDEGFCEIKYENILNDVTIFLLTIIALPLSFYELNCLGNNFSLMKSYKFSVIASFCLMFLHAILSITPFHCFSITSVIPHDILFILYNCLFTYPEFIRPLINLIIIEIKIQGLESNKKSLIKILNKNVLYDEFLDYCNKKCCGEYALFHKEYLKFRRVVKQIAIKNDNNPYDSNEFINSSFSTSCLSVLTTNTNDCDYSVVNIHYLENEIGNTDGKKRKFSNSNTIDKSSILKSAVTEGLSSNCQLGNYEPNDNGQVQSKYDNLFRIINEINSKFFEKDCELELNISDRIVKKIKINLTNFNDSYDKMKNNQSYNPEPLHCERIFDEAYRECIETLYHNVYSSYVVYKKSGKNATELNILNNSKNNLGSSEALSLRSPKF
ncbi:hypothetical protein BCR32DRAFT_293173 [Anaeromyces robustus]|uniref:RGS domain-containing protein n=1 Tax=Anaeromyces robustus TaxID=1754192 RepID=A0A1Y1X7B5_9FUNG|nr:hypothetical protein BCR32DRAFT_293173 [Anaeromyces robustus]|eukprot:ORX81661.1 hypothetical protein BCR32DRAFT_293173 [Anaeromyces robustus]